MIKFSLAASAAFFMLAGPAAAQGVDLNPVMRDVVMPTMVSILAAVGSAAISFGFAAFRRKTGVQIDAGLREGLQSALWNGLNYGVAKVGGLGKIPKIDLGSPVLNFGVEYVLRSVPDAVRKFDLSPKTIEDMLIAKVPQLQVTEADKAQPRPAPLPDPAPVIAKTSSPYGPYFDKPRVGGKD